MLQVETYRFSLKMIVTTTSRTKIGMNVKIGQQLIN
jgi:hypothetical protein